MRKVPGTIIDLGQIYIKRPNHEKNVASFGLIDQTFGEPVDSVNVGKSC